MPLLVSISHTKGMAKKPVLILDDEEEILETLKMALEMFGFSVVTGVNGQEGLEALKTMDVPGLVILDLMMPVMNGIEFARHLRADPRYAKIPIIVISAFPEKAKDIPDITELMEKPMDLDLLLKMARRYCE